MKRGCWPLVVGVLLCGCALIPPSQKTGAISVTTEATAANCDVALRQAKALAADNVAGTFVHGQRTLNEDRDYSEKLNEYTSGVVQRYTVLEKIGDQPCRVKIEAWVEPGKGHVHLNQGSNAVEAGDMNERASQIPNNRQFLAQHFRDTKDFAIQLGQLEVLEVDQTCVSASLQVDAILPPQRWLNDLESYLRVHGDPVVYERDSRSKALDRLFSLKRPGKKSPPAPWDFEICFIHEKGEQIRCYTGETNRKIIRVLRSPAIDIKLATRQGRKDVAQQAPLSMTFYTHKSLGTRYIAPDFEARSDFPMIAAAPLPIKLGMTHPGKQFPADAKLTAHLRFRDVNQFPLNER